MTLHVPGLHNAGNTCFLASVLQALAASRCLVESLQQSIHTLQAALDRRSGGRGCRVASGTTSSGGDTGGSCASSGAGTSCGAPCVPAGDSGVPAGARAVLPLVAALLDCLLLLQPSERRSTSWRSLSSSPAALRPHAVLAALDLYRDVQLGDQQDAAEVLLSLAEALTSELRAAHAAHLAPSAAARGTWLATPATDQLCSRQLSPHHILAPEPEPATAVPVAAAAAAMSAAAAAGSDARGRADDSTAARQRSDVGGCRNGGGDGSCGASSGGGDDGGGCGSRGGDGGGGGSGGGGRNCCRSCISCGDQGAAAGAAAAGAARAQLEEWRRFAALPLVGVAGTLSVCLRCKHELKWRLSCFTTLAVDIPTGGSLTVGGALVAAAGASILDCLASAGRPQVIDGVHCPRCSLAATAMMQLQASGGAATSCSRTVASDGSTPGCRSGGTLGSTEASGGGTAASGGGTAASGGCADASCAVGSGTGSGRSTRRVGLLQLAACSCPLVEEGLEEACALSTGGGWRTVSSPVMHRERVCVAPRLLCIQLIRAVWAGDAGHCAKVVGQVSCPLTLRATRQGPRGELAFAAEDEEEEEGSFPPHTLWALSCPPSSGSAPPAVASSERGGVPRAPPALPWVGDKEGAQQQGQGQGQGQQQQQGRHQGMGQQQQQQQGNGRGQAQQAQQGQQQQGWGRERAASSSSYAHKPRPPMPAPQCGEGYCGRDSCRRLGCQRYCLVALVVHTGVTGSGHYTVYRRVKDGGGGTHHGNGGTHHGDGAVGSGGGVGDGVDVGDGVGGGSGQSPAGGSGGCRSSGGCCTRHGGRWFCVSDASSWEVGQEEALGAEATLVLYEQCPC